MRKTTIYALIVFAVVFGMRISCAGQKLYYSEADPKSYAANTDFTVAKSGNHILAWTFNVDKKVLTARMFDSRMQLLDKAMLKPEKINDFVTMSLFHEAHGDKLVLQYRRDREYITQVFVYDSITNAITAGKILNRQNVYGIAAVLYSSDDRYTAFMRAFNTLEDSILIQYAVYSDTERLIKSGLFVLPQKHNFVSVDKSLLDTSGNLYFSAIGRSTDSTLGEGLSLYEISLTKDSLLSNHFYRKEDFSNISIQQNIKSGTISVSGYLSQKTNSSTLTSVKLTQNLFIMILDNNLAPEVSLTLYPVNQAVTSHFGTSTHLETGTVILYRDSGYLFYSTGLTGLTTTTKGNYFSSRNPLPPFSTMPGHPTPEAAMRSSYSPINWNPVADNRNYVPYSFRSTVINTGGEHFLTALRLGKSSILSSAFFKDSVLLSQDITNEFSMKSEYAVHCFFSKPARKTSRRFTILFMILTGGFMYC